MKKKNISNNFKNDKKSWILWNKIISQGISKPSITWYILCDNEIITVMCSVFLLRHICQYHWRTEHQKPWRCRVTKGPRWSQSPLTPKSWHPLLWSGIRPSEKWKERPSGIRQSHPTKPCLQRIHTPTPPPNNASVQPMPDTPQVSGLGPGRQR